jgi:flavin-binding protein dodecin
MADRVFKKIRLTGCSAESIERAVQLAVSKAAETVHGMAWFEVVEVRGAIHDERPVEWQVTVDINLKVD